MSPHQRKVSEIKGKPLREVLREIRRRNTLKRAREIYLVETEKGFLVKRKGDL